MYRMYSSDGINSKVVNGLKKMPEIRRPINVKFVKLDILIDWLKIYLLRICPQLSSMFGWLESLT